MTVDYLAWAKELDAMYGSRVARHDKKVAAIASTLQPSEYVLFLTDVNLHQAIRDDIVAVTARRLLTIRNNGKRVDELPLAAAGTLAVGSPSNIGTQLTIDFGGIRWKARVNTDAAAQVLVEIIVEAATAARSKLGLDRPSVSFPADKRDHSLLVVPPPHMQRPQRGLPEEPHTAEFSRLVSALNQAIEKRNRCVTADVARFDSLHSTDASRHTHKVAAIPGSLELAESIAFITEGKLYGSFRSDIYVVTDTRLLIIREDGNRVDAIRLNEVSAIDASNLPLVLEVQSKQDRWIGSVSSAHAAIIFVYAILAGTSRHTLAAGLSAVAVEPPNSYETHQDAAVAVPFIRGFGNEAFGHEILDPEHPPNWVLVFRDLLLPDEVLLGVWDVRGPDASDLVFAIASKQLIVSRSMKRGNGRLLPVDGGTADIERVLLVSIEDIRVTAHLDAEPDTLEFHAAGSVYSYMVNWEFGEVIEQFATDLRAAVAFSNSKDSTDSCPADPLYWPAQALDLLVGASEVLPEPDPSVKDPTFDKDRKLVGHRIHSMSNLERNRLFNRFALAYGLDLSRHAESVEVLTAAIDDGESLYCLTQTAKPGEPESVLLALTSDWIYVVGDSAEDVALFPLEEVTAINGQPGRTIGRIELTLSGEDFAFRSVPSASIEMFVAAANRLRPGASARLEQQDDEADSLYHPTTIHGLDQGDLALVYDRLAAETIDFGDLTKWQLSHLPEVMLPGELLIWMAEGYLQGSFKDPGDSGRTMVAVTDRRLLLLVDPELATNQVKAFRLTDITAVHRDGGFITGGFRFREAGGGQRKITKMHQSSADSIVAKLQAAIDAAQPSKPQASQAQGSQAPISDVADQLEKLANLVDRGFLTPEEFAEQKAKLLNG